MTACGNGRDGFLGLGIAIGGKLIECLLITRGLPQLATEEQHGKGEQEHSTTFEEGGHFGP